MLRQPYHDHRRIADLGRRLYFNIDNQLPQNSFNNSYSNLGQSIRLRRTLDRVLLQRIEEAEEIKGGIIIPDSAKEKPQEAKVIALGTGALDKDGKKVAFNVKPTGTAAK